MANLWDVTDRDIDRFALALLQRWAPDQEAAGGGSSGSSLHPDGGQEPEGAADSPAGSSVNEALVRQTVCIARSVALSRAACRLPHLIGAAPVCYGVPTSVRPALLPRCSEV